MRDIIIILCMFSLTSCSTGQKTYETFKRNMNLNIGSTLIAKSKSWSKKDYDDASYMYLYIGDNPRAHHKCIYGYITNKNDPKQVITGWKIISGKEYCKEAKRYACCI